MRLADWLLDHLPESFAGAMLSALGWWMQRKLARAEAMEIRIAALERDKVTRDDIDELRESMNSSITHAFARVETRTDEILLHLAQRDSR